MAAGAIGVLLELAGVRSATVSVLVLVFIVVAPTAAIAGLLRGFDLFARIILAAVTAAAGITLIAMIMLTIGAWSVKGGLVAIAILSAACLLAQRGRAARLWSSPGMKRLRGNLMPGRIPQLSGWLAARMTGLSARWRPGGAESQGAPAAGPAAAPPDPECARPAEPGTPGTGDPAAGAQPPRLGSHLLSCPHPRKIQRLRRYNPQPGNSAGRADYVSLMIFFGDYPRTSLI